MVQASKNTSPGAAAPKVTPESVLRAQRFPVTRWNRTYIIIIAGLLSSAVAAAFLFGFSTAAKRKPKDDAQTKSSEIAPSSPGFGNKYQGGYADPALQSVAARNASVGERGAPGTAGLPPTEAAIGSLPTNQNAPSVPSPQPSPDVGQARAEAHAARASTPFFGGGAVGTEVRDRELATPAFIPTGVEQGSPAMSDVQPANGQGGKRQFLNSARSQDYLPTPLRGPFSRWEVKAGTIIPAALITAINSDLPGEIIAQVTQPVYDHVTGRSVLIPQGSRLIGIYDSQVAYGQSRALIAWTRLIMPDGRSINIGSMGGTDLSGAAGLQDQVDGHFGQLARGIFLSSVFSVGAASAQDASSRSSGELVVNSAATGAANSAQQVGQQITSRDLNRQPTLKIRAGFPLTVLVNKDMVLAP